MPRAIIHEAGEPDADLRQRCVVCGAVLVDNVGDLATLRASALSRPAFFAPGTVTVQGPSCGIGAWPGATLCLSAGEGA